MELELEGKVCVVTGGGSGIGRATVEALAREGAAVVVVDREQASAGEVARAVDGRALGLDVTAADAPDRVLELASTLGGIDVLVNNAGTSYVRPIDGLSDQDWNLQWELHVLAPMRLMRLAAPAMAARGGGRIVNVCSSVARKPTATNAAYSVTKAGELTLTRVFADAFAEHGVLINAVNPGDVASPLWVGPGGLAEQAAAARGLDPSEVVGRQSQSMPLGRFAEPSEIAAVIVFLCSGQSGFVTGSGWAVDGGQVPVI
jgi:NAD(P)-dependent dehydrogenase (short-subunit alcohol dehydrogenase family)